MTPIEESTQRRPYGTELILDLHECDPSTFTRRCLKDFLRVLCDEILKMERHDLHFWDDVGVPPEDQQTDPRTKGTTAIQFILTSNVTIHTLDLQESVYINVFSCDQFDSDTVSSFAREFFAAKEHHSQTVVRT